MSTETTAEERASSIHQRTVLRLDGVARTQDLGPGINPTGVDLRLRQLSAANLDNAQLRDANLHGVDLQKASLMGADLQGANLGGANLREANLDGANLMGATPWVRISWVRT